MTAFQRRCFIAIDEWLGILLLYSLCPVRWREELFAPVLAFWAVAVYFGSYLPHWFENWRQK